MGRRSARGRGHTPEPAAPQVSWSSYVWPLAFLLVAVGSIYIFANLRKTPPSLSVQRGHLSKRSYREVAELRNPLILIGTVADKWQAKNSFTPTFLAQQLPYVMAHRQETKRSFVTFHDNKPLEPLVNERWEDFNVKVNVTIPELLGWHKVDKNLSSGPFLYFSQNITTLRSVFPDIMDHVQPLSDLILDPDSAQINLWIGRAGIITHTHYDCTFNFFVQLRGRKRFTLFPPDSPMYLYPCLHPHYGHSQVDILSPDLSLFPEYSTAASWVADVGPGDMLVIPPFWFHHVETLEQSVSVNVWSDAPEYSVMNRIYEQPIPFEEHWTWQEIATAARIYVDLLLQSQDVDNTSHFIESLVDQRYEPVVSSRHLNVSDRAVAMVRTFCSTVQWQKETSRLFLHLKHGISLLQPLFNLIATRAILDICLGNYVEHLLHLAVGLDHVYPLLTNCF